MRIGNVILDPESMTISEVDEAIQKLRALRARKVVVRDRYRTLRSLLINAKEDGLCFCNRHTGEVLKADDWIVYDNVENMAYEEAE